MKNIALIVRRPDHDRDAFRKHYEEIHAPLAMETVMEGTTRYVRYHVTDDLYGAPGFDVVTEFKFRDVEAAAGLMKRLQTELGQRIFDDERSFMDRDRNVFFGATEHLVRGAEDRSAASQLVVLAKAPEGADPETFVRDYEHSDVPALLDAVQDPLWCQQNRSFAVGPVAPAFDVVTHVHARGPVDLETWASGLAARTSQILVLAVAEHETETPW